MANGPCPLYGTHQMVSKGTADARDYNTNSELFAGGWYKCACSERFVCEGFPHYGWPIGHYITEGAIVAANIGSMAASFWTYPSYVNYTSSSTLEGYRFLQSG